MSSYCRAAELFTHVLVASPRHDRALSARSECYRSLGDLEACLADLTELTTKFKAAAEPSTLQAWLSKLAAVRSELRQGPHETLGVTHDASEAEVKKAYRALCLNWHPDKHAASSDDTRARAKHKFERVQAAYTTLQATFERRRGSRAGSGRWHQQGYGFE